MTEYKLRGYLVNPLGVNKIREVATHARDILRLTEKPVDMGDFLESLVRFDIVIDIIDELDMPGLLSHSEACCIPERRTIYLTNETYERSCENDPRSRFTIFHELGHFFLMHNRKFHRDNNFQKIKPKHYLDSEWQADQFAAETLMPLKTIISERLFAPRMIQERFGVSARAAEKRLRQLKERGDIKSR
ncbi:ImmA/IrrE family metallo-endopeptidase [Nitrosomonas communis]|uniref:IrrE N-terminal-like domain-containing protein n=1 Tax=Nitrosomonas communis TaxID=44574 RepID=A0A1I4RUU5_9PROT|nr:ImmA/IrrE family metallo-endopeptidase [Nitrosomonas communis]SFM56017.1 protein of unknown function [Nitrosomonas communis]